jgi:hypothetical protein
MIPQPDSESAQTQVRTAIKFQVDFELVAASLSNFAAAFLQFAAAAAPARPGAPGCIMMQVTSLRHH